MLLAIDPGRSKTGWAVTDDSGELICSGIVPTDRLDVFFRELFTSRSEVRRDFLIEGSARELECPKLVICGNGTTSAALEHHLRGLGVPFEWGDERNSTLEARSVYWTLHRPRGWHRLVPLSLQTPPRDLDDLAALCILRRFLARGSEAQAPGGE